MRYKFPHIENISQVLPLLVNRPEFVVSEKEGGYTVVNYCVMMNNTFPPVVDEETAILRELRGMIFDTGTGKVLRRPYHKFFNAGEREETQLRELDLSLPHVILEKLDGSMLVPFRTTDGIRWGTKMGCTDVAKPVEEFVKRHPIYETFALWAESEGFTAIFEWCSRKQTIVIDYPEDMLVLTAIRENKTGKYLSYAQLVDEVDGTDIPVVKAYEGIASNMQALVAETKDLVGVEGYVVRFNDGHMVKVKAEDYLRKHKTKEAIQREKNVIELLVTEKADDVKAFMDPKDLERFNAFEEKFWHGVKDTVIGLHGWRLFAQSLELDKDRKQYAVEFVQTKPTKYHKFLYQMFNYKPDEVLGMVKDYIVHNCGTQAKIDECRWLFNCSWDSKEIDE